MTSGSGNMSPVFRGLPVALVAFTLVVAGCVTMNPEAEPPFSTPVPKVTLVAVDIETTGLDAKTCRIVEMGAVKFRGRRELERMSWLVNPGEPIPQSAVRVHGITDGMVARSPAFKDVLPEFARFTSGCVLLMHNARFDDSFIRAELDRCGAAGPGNLIVDTLPLFRQWFPESLRHSIAFLAQQLGLETKRLHRATTDASLDRTIFWKGLARHGYSWKLGQLVEMSGGERRLTNSTERASGGGK